MAVMIFKVVVKISAQVAKENPLHKGHKPALRQACRQAGEGTALEESEVTGSRSFSG
jgi:hypothetical protein